MKEPNKMKIIIFPRKSTFSSLMYCLRIHSYWISEVILMGFPSVIASAVFLLAHFRSLQTVPLDTPILSPASF